MRIKKAVKSQFSGVGKLYICADIILTTEVYTTIYFNNYSTKFILFIAYLDIIRDKDTQSKLSFHIDFIINAT